MALEVSVKITGDDRVLKKMKHLGRGLYDFRRAMDRIGTQLEAYYEQQPFKSLGGVYGKRWARLAPATVRNRAKTATIGSSATEPLNTGNPNGMQHSFYHESDSTSAFISNKKPYFKYHQSTAPRRKLPRRQMIGINSAVERIVSDEFEKDIEMKIREA